MTNHKLEKKKYQLEWTKTVITLFFTYVAAIFTVVNAQDIFNNLDAVKQVISLITLFVIVIFLLALFPLRCDEGW